MKNQHRNINPNKAAKAAMWLYGQEYAQFGGGAMDFWDSLPKIRKRKCVQMLKDIEGARPYTGSFG